MKRLKPEENQNPKQIKFTTRFGRKQMGQFVEQTKDS